MIGSTVFLLIALFLPDREPIFYSEPAESLPACLAEAGDLLSKADSGPLRESGGQMRVGCEIQTPPSIDH